MSEAIKITGRLFGDIEYDSEDGLWEYINISLDGRSCQCRLDIESELEDVALIQKLMDAIPEMMEKSKAAFLQGYPENDTIALFVDYQIEEIEHDTLMTCLDVQTEEGITPQNFLRKLQLTGVSIDGSYECVMDFCLDKDVTDALLVVTFDESLKILSIRHES